MYLITDEYILFCVIVKNTFYYYEFVENKIKLKKKNRIKN